MNETPELEKTFIKVDEELLRTALQIASFSLENTQMLLDNNDASFGRKNRKDRNWAETLEKDLKEIKSFQENLRKLLGFQMIQKHVG